MTVKPAAESLLMVPYLLLVACGAQSGRETADVLPVAEVAAPAADGALLAPVELVAQMSDLAWAGEVDQAQTLIESQRATHDTASPEWLLAVSWLGRGASFESRWGVAAQYAREAFEGSVALLDVHDLVDNRSLELALGAGIEVLGQAINSGGDRDEAVTFLIAQREAYRDTPIETRIQKNVMLLSLEGQLFPTLDVKEYVGEPQPTGESLEGKVVVAFFWAHWCPDCKRQVPVLEQLHEEYGDQIVILGPTQLYGYISRGQDATPEQELAYLRGVYQERFPIPSFMSVPVSQQNFVDFGVSTTPTLVVIDPEGVVRLYNPGDMSYEELRPHIQRLLS